MSVYECFAYMYEYMYVFFLFICSILCVSSAHRSQKRAANCMELELAISYRMDAENQTQGFWKKNKWF